MMPLPHFGHLLSAVTMLVLHRLLSRILCRELKQSPALMKDLGMHAIDDRHYVWTLYRFFRIS